MKLLLRIDEEYHASIVLSAMVVHVRISRSKGEFCSLDFVFFWGGGSFCWVICSSPFLCIYHVSCFVLVWDVGDWVTADTPRTHKRISRNAVWQ